MTKEFQIVLVTIIIGIFIGYGMAFTAFKTPKKAFIDFERRLGLLELNQRNLVVLMEAYVKDSNKFRKSFRRVDNVLLTGYSNDKFSINVPQFRDGITATGTLARPGVVAADFTKFPSGSLLYIVETNRWYRVEDTGSAMRKYKGHQLDIFFTKYWDAIDFGRKTSTVYVFT